MKRFIRHCKRWNEWRKPCRNNLLYKIYVFFNPKISPTYQLLISYEKKKDIIDAFLKGIEDGMREVEQKGGAE